MSQIVAELFEQAYQRHRKLRQFQTCFHAFGGAVIEAFRERGYRVVGFDSAAGCQILNFEQPDGDRVSLVIEPYSEDPKFLKAVGAIAEIQISLNQRISDPELVAKAQAAQLRQGVGAMLGTFSSHGSGLAQRRMSQALAEGQLSGFESSVMANRFRQLDEPGNLRFRLQGVEANASINLICRLDDFSTGGIDYDTPKVGEMLDAAVYGLEKFLHGMIMR